MVTGKSTELTFPKSFLIFIISKTELLKRMNGQTDNITWAVTSLVLEQ